MNEHGATPYHRRRFSLPVRVSLILMVAAILPLVITVVMSEALSRPALTAQARTAMDTDASERVQLIDRYLHERLLDAQTLVQVPSVAEYLLTPPERMTQDIYVHSLYALQAGINRDKNYTVWALFDARGNLMQYFPLNMRPIQHGSVFIPTAYLQKVKTGNFLFSGVYYDTNTRKGWIDIYAPLTVKKQVIGFLRASLNLDFVWNVIDGERNANGPGSYAFMLDEHGVRIADPDPAKRFTSVAPLSNDLQLQVRSEDLYGLPGDVIPLDDPAIAQSLNDQSVSSTFEATPTGQNESFQIVRHRIQTVPWTYYVLSPTSTVTAVVNQQLMSTMVIAAGILLLAAIAGWFVGQRITSPILRSVDNLRRSTEALNLLATKQQSAASEQQWVVDSSQVGLQSVQYYTDATNVAARQLSELANELLQRWSLLDAQTAQRVLKEMLNTARYIENAVQYQENSNQKLATAIKVTTQVTEQLATGATSAADAAAQLEEVVDRLRDVVGR